MYTTIKIVLISFLSYYLSGKLGLFLAITPGFASVVWPASGVALACIIILKSRWALLGFFLGSFYLNTQVNIEISKVISMGTILIPFCIAISSSFQVYVAYHLINRIKLNTSSIKRVIHFIVFSGILACCIAPTLSVLTLFLSDSIQYESIFFNWVTWWVGDLLGILLFTPLVIILFSRNLSLGIKQRLLSVIPTCILFLGSIFIFLSSTNAYKNKSQFEINENANQYFDQIKQNLNIAKTRLDAYSAFYNSTDTVTRVEFNLFTSELLKHTDIFQGIGWTKIIPHSQRELVVNSIQKQGFENFNFMEFSENGLVIAEKREFYYPVLNIYPLEGNQQAFGLDLGSNQARKDALELAKKSGESFSTPPIILAQETENKKAIIIYEPIFNLKNNNQFIGFISGVLKAKNVINTIIELANKQNLEIRIQDITNKKNPIWLIPPLDNEISHTYSGTNKEFIFSGRIFDIQVQPLLQFNTSHKDWNSWIILIICLLITSLMQALFFILIRQNDLVSIEVNNKTKALKEATLEATKANKAKSDFLANMSHELRTPMNAIIGLVNLCLKTKLTPQQEDYLTKANIASDTLLTLINHTLDYSKIEAGHLEIERREFDFHNLLNSLYAIFNSSAEQKNIEFKIKSLTSFPRNIFSDELRIKQVIINICSNAIKFTKDGSISVNIRSKKINKDHYELILEVIDTGIGIEEEKQTLLFQPFKQADNSTSRNYGGTGLGLSISKKIVNAMHGDIILDSKVGQGSQFTISFKVETQENTELVHYKNNILSANKMDITYEKMPFKNKHFLLVEDIMVNQIIAQEMLELLGAKVDLADNGQVALTKIKLGQDYDLVLMDIQMPVMDGYQACKEIRTTHTKEFLPIIAMTANAMKSDIENCKKVGMDDHISKPIDEKKMIETILKYIH